MTPFEFDEVIKRMSQVFKPLNEEQKEIYWQALRNTPFKLFDRAASLVISTHNKRYFPLVAQIKRAVLTCHKNAMAAIAEKKRTEPPCELCNNTGYVVVEKVNPETGIERGVAEHCGCRLGQAMKRGLIQQEREAHLPKARLQYEDEVDQELGYEEPEEPGLFDGEDDDKKE